MCHMQMTYGISSVHVQWSPHRKSRADNHDIIRWCQNDCSYYLGREVYKESLLGLQSCCLGFWHWTVRTIVKSPTLYSGYINASHEARVYSGWTAFLVYSWACTQMLWEHFSYYDLSCLTVSWVGHYLHPLEPSIKQGMDYNLSQQIA